MRHEKAQKTTMKNCEQCGVIEGWGHHYWCPNARQGLADALSDIKVAKNAKPEYPRNVTAFVEKWQPAETARRKAFWKEFRKAANAYSEFRHNTQAEVDFFPATCSAWLPMESAPKDRELLVCWGTVASGAMGCDIVKHLYDEKWQSALCSDRYPADGFHLQGWVELPPLPNNPPQ